ncbi:MAG: putative manganese transporter [Candidatus Thiodiazotropha sp.]
MTTLTHALQRHLPGVAFSRDPGVRRAGVVALFAFAALSIPGGIEAAAGALADAYLAVSVFVAGTIALVLAAERGLGIDLASLLNRYRRWHVPAGILLGAFPGCGGAIVAVTQFTRGHLSFGGLVATLIATMGDAMFLLLAQEPATAASVLVASAVMGLVTGYTVDAWHGPDFLRPRPTFDNPRKQARQPWLPRRWRRGERLWLTLALPGLAAGILGAFQIDVDALLPGSPAMMLGLAGALLALGMWVVRGGENAPCDSSGCEIDSPLLRRVVNDTNFVTSWVIFAFLGYELMMTGLGIDPTTAIAVWGPLVPALAILIGFVPGCGPQIVVTSLYLSGAMPLSAQLGNAIANDGDALFPAIAVAPKAALVATLYSALPALVAAYGWYWLIEGG